MSEPINHLQKVLAEIVDRHTDRDGPQPTEIPSLSFSRYSIPHHSAVTGPPYRLSNPLLCIVVQGMKDVILGEDRFSYGPSNYLVASMDLPIIAKCWKHPPKSPT